MKTRKRLLFRCRIGFVALLVLVLAACGGEDVASAPEADPEEDPEEAAPEQDAEPEAPEEAAEEPEDEDADLLRRAAEEGEVVWYTSWPDDVSGTIVDMFNEKYPEVSAAHVRAGTVTTAARITTEVESGSLGGDVVAISEESIRDTLAEQGYVECTDVRELGEYLEGFVDPAGCWATPRLLLGTLWYNVEGLEAAGLEPPSSWMDLVEEEYAQHTVVPSPLASGTAASLIAATAPKADYGWEYWESYSLAGGSFIENVPDVARAVAAGEFLIGYTAWGYLESFPLYPEGSVEVAVPEEGVVVIPSSAMLLADRPHEAAGELFYRFLIGPDVADYLTDNYQHSGRADAPTPTDMLPLEEIPEFTRDIEWSADAGEEIERRWPEIISMGRG